MTAEDGQREPIRIGDLELDRDRHEVRRDGVALKLPKLSYRMFLALVDAAPAVLTHDELVDQVWDGRVVSPETVTQRVKLLRAALDDDAGDPRYVALVRGEGYRLIPEVRRPSSSAAPSPVASEPVRNWAAMIAVSFVVAVIAAGGLYVLLDAGGERSSGAADDPVRAVRPNSVAVLPFDNVSLDAQDGYLAQGMASTLIDQLSYVDELSVMARSSSATVTGDDATAIATRLGVERLIEGTLERNGDRFAITASIVEGDSGFRTWSERFEGSRDELPVLQREIAGQIIAALVPDYAGAAVSRGSASLDPTAYDLMLLASARYEDVRDQPTVDEEKLDEAIALFRRLTTLEPDSAQAHSRLAAALLYKGDVQAAAGPIYRALRIDPENAEAHYTQGLYKWMLYEDGTGEALERAISLNPNYADAQEAYAKYVWHQLISDVPEQHFRRALELDPQRLTRYADLASFYALSGRREKALEIASTVASRFDNTDALMLIARTHESVGDVDEAIAWAMRAREQAPQRDETAWMIAELYARLGDFETARRYEPEPAFNLLYWERRYEEMIELGEELIFDQPGQSQIWYGMARALIATGQYESAIDYLRRQNIPARAFSENRRAPDEEALVLLADALRLVGRVDEARQMVAEFRPYLLTMLSTGGENYWWPHLYMACIDSILGDDAAALASLDRMQGTSGMPWYPLLADEPCFRRLEGQAIYEQVLRFEGDRKAGLRARLAETLQRHQRDRPLHSVPTAGLRTNDSKKR